MITSETGAAGFSLPVEESVSIKSYCPSFEEETPEVSTIGSGSEFAERLSHAPVSSYIRSIATIVLIL